MNNKLESYLKQPHLEFSDQELIALIIGGADQKAHCTAKRLLAYFGGLKKLAQAEANEIYRQKGIGKAAAIRIHAGLRAGRRALFAHTNLGTIHTPYDAYTILRPLMEGYAEESLWALYLNRRKQLLLTRKLTHGNDGFTIVDPKQVYRHALHVQASGIIVAHNHPSGDPTPSTQDIEITQRLNQAGKILNIPLLDHLIIGNDDFQSLASSGILEGLSSD